MKGIILTGGTGTRLKPLTDVTNKHVLPVNGRPMLYYPLDTLYGLNIRDILVILGGNDIGHVIHYCELWAKDKDLTLTYRYQAKPGGIAQAIGLGKDFVGKDNVAVILGDNIFTVPQVKRNDVPACYLYHHEHPENYGVARFKAGVVVEFIEKPKKWVGWNIVTGLYLFPSDVFQVIPTLKPSGRGELEVTDLLNHYLKRITPIKVKGAWFDVGEFAGVEAAEKALRGVKSENKKVNECSYTVPKKTVLRCPYCGAIIAQEGEQVTPTKFEKCSFCLKPLTIGGSEITLKEVVK